MGWAFGEYELDKDVYELRRRGQVQHLEPQAFEVLAHLVANRHRVVTKAELLREVWGSRAVTESALTTRIKEVRKALGDDGRAQAAIRTVHGRGYRFVGEVRGDAVDSFAVTTDAAPRRSDQVVRYCTAPDGVRLAFTVVGDGPVVVQDTVPLAPLVPGLERGLSHEWIEMLGNGRRLVRYDRRGAGLSQHDIPPITVDGLVADLAAVVDAAAVDRFALIAHSIPAMVAVRFAVAHPHRVERLVLVGCPLMGPLAPQVPAAQRAEFELNVQLFTQGWGSDRVRLRRMVAKSVMPDAPPHVWDRFADLRHDAPIENLAEVFRVTASIDLTDDAPQLRMPTMVIHSRGDAMVPFRRGQDLARRIPDARFVTLPSVNHLLHAGDAAWPHFTREVEAFLRS